jgi:hypothetical protein
VRGKCAITADTALRLGQYFKMEPQSFDGGTCGGSWRVILGGL